MSEENNTSNPASDYRVVKKEELEALAKTEDIGTVVRVSDDDFKYNILLDDYRGNKFWNVFNGTDKEFALKSNEWFKDGQKKFNEDAPSKEDTDRLREALLAISVLSNFFSWDEETTGKMMDQLIIKFSYDQYKLKTGSEKKLEDLEDDNEYFGYLNMTAIMVKAFTTLVNDVRQCVDGASQESDILSKTVQN